MFEILTIHVALCVAALGWGVDVPLLKGPTGGAAMLLAAVLGGKAAVIFLGCRIVDLSTYKSPIQAGLGAWFGSRRWSEALPILAFAATAEELLFRGVLPSLLGVWASSGLFGLYHAADGGGGWRTATTVVLTAAMGLAFCWVADEFGLGVAIGVHLGSNMMSWHLWRRLHHVSQQETARYAADLLVHGRTRVVTGVFSKEAM